MSPIERHLGVIVARGRDPDSIILSAQLDNVLSVALIVHLFCSGFADTALFTAQEEAGRSWRYALSWLKRESITTRRLLVLDANPYPTPEAAAEQDLVLRKIGRHRLVRRGFHRGSPGPLPHCLHSLLLQRLVDRREEHRPHQATFARSHRAGSARRRHRWPDQRHHSADPHH